MTTQQEMNNRTKEIAEYFVKNCSTVRKTAKKFGISKTVIHKELTERLKDAEVRFAKDRDLYEEVRSILDHNISQRAIRGGEATRRKYKNNPKSSG